LPRPLPSKASKALSVTIITLKKLILADLVRDFPVAPIPKPNGEVDADDFDLAELTAALQGTKWPEISYSMADEYSHDLPLLSFNVCNYYFPGFLWRGLEQAKKHSDITILFYVRCLYDEGVGKHRAQDRLKVLLDPQLSVVRSLISAPMDEDPQGMW